MWSSSDHQVRNALGAELGFMLRSNTWLSLGYNVTGFSDRDFNAVVNTSATTRGAFLRLRLKFDEDLWGAGRPETPGGVDGRQP
jgi:hypothetical protein